MISNLDSKMTKGKEQIQTKISDCKFIDYS